MGGNTRVEQPGSLSVLGGFSTFLWQGSVQDQVEEIQTGLSRH